MGQWNDRKFYIEATDKAVRLGGASWVEPTGAVVLWDDFVGDTLNTDAWIATDTAAAGLGSSAFAISSTAGDPVAAHGGWISGTCSDNDSGSTEIGSMAATTVGNFRPDRAGNGLLVFETRITLPAITTIRVNAGLTDDEAEANAVLAMSLSGTTWTTTATDAALWVFDTAATTDVFYGQTVDSDADGTAVTGTAPVAATALRLRIEIGPTGSVYFYRDGNYVGSETAVGVTETVPLIPYLGVANEGAANKVLEADYVLTACAR